jgi:hypothetical protein
MNKPATCPDENSSAQGTSKSVVVLGLVSFFSDFASNIVIPLIPIMLVVTVLAAGPLAPGLIEGTIDSA